MKKVFIIVPSRGGRESLWDLIDSYTKTRGERTEMLVVIDKDETNKYKRLFEEVRMGVTVVVLDKRYMLTPKLNIVAEGIIRGDFGPSIGVAFMGDDCVFQTENWEDRVVNKIEENRGIVYCNDLLQGEILPNNIFIHREIVEAVGSMAPPTLTHFYIDNYWKDLGIRINNIHYFADIIIEHKHYSNGKAVKDALYLECEKLADPDHKAYDMYVHLGHLASDTRKVLIYKSTLENNGREKISNN